MIGRSVSNVEGPETSPHTSLIKMEKSSAQTTKQRVSIITSILSLINVFQIAVALKGILILDLEERYVNVRSNTPKTLKENVNHVEN